MGFSREVKDFVAGFQSGWKMIDDAQSKDVYNRYLESKMGDEDLSKYDPRLKATPKTGFGKILGGWFGGDEEGETPVLEGADRGRAVLDAKMKRAIEQGDVATYEKLVKQRLLLNQYGTTGAPGFEPVKPPKAPGLSGAAPDPVIPVEPEYSRGGMVQRFALGGMAEGMPDDADPARLYSAAEPAVAAGLRAIQSRLNVPAVDDGTPNPEVEKFAKGEGRMSEEEIRAIDAKVDPDSELTPGQRSAARLSAVYQFYGNEDPDTAADAAARLLLREKWVSQARGALALRALEQDDTQSAAKLVADAYNENLPDGNTIHVKVDPVDKGVLFKQISAAGQEIFGGKVDKRELVQLASNTADGSIFTSRLAQVAGMADKKRGAGAAGSVDASAFNAAKQNYIAVSQAENADPAEVQKAEAAMQSEYQKLIMRISPKKPSSGAWTLDKMGIKLPGAPGAGASGSVKLTEKEREAAAAEAQDKSFRGDAAAAIRGAAGNVIQASANQQYKNYQVPEGVDVSMPPEYAGVLPTRPMQMPEGVNAPQTVDEVLSGVSGSFSREFALTPESKALNMTARDLLQGSLEARDQLEANINARKNKRDVKFGDQDRLEESINTLFDDLDKGPLSGVAVAQGGGQKVVNPDVASKADVDNLKQWTYRAMIYNDDLMLGTASKVVLGLTSINAKNPMAAPFKVSMDKKDQGRVVLTDGSGLSLNLDGDSIRQILLWRKNKVEEYLKKQGEEAGKPSIAEKVGAVGGAAVNLATKTGQAIAEPFYGKDAQTGEPVFVPGRIVGTVADKLNRSINVGAIPTGPQDPPQTRPPVRSRRSLYSPNSSTIDARDLLGPDYGTGAAR